MSEARLRVVLWNTVRGRSKPNIITAAVAGVWLGVLALLASFPVLKAAVIAVASRSSWFAVGVAFLAIAPLAPLLFERRKKPWWQRTAELDGVRFFELILRVFACAVAAAGTGSLLLLISRMIQAIVR